MKLPWFILGACHCSLLANLPGLALSIRLQSGSPDTRPKKRHALEHELDEREQTQRQAAGAFQTLVQGLTQWADKAASLQELTFMTRFRDWLQGHSRASAQVETVLEGMAELLEWSDCAGEGSDCSCTSGIVRFGYNNHWVYRNSSNDFACSVHTFQKDPLPGYFKSCQCRRPLDSAQWEDCASEGRTCICDRGVARYGTSRGWAYRNFSGEFDCSNFEFLRDPVPGLLKTCQCQRPAQKQISRNRSLIEGPLLWSCGTAPPPGSGPSRQPALALEASTRQLCSDRQLDGLLDVHLDPRFEEGFARWADKSGWVEEAYVTYMTSKKNDNYEWMATNLLRSVQLFSTRPIVVVNFNRVFEPPASWLEMRNLIVYRMRPEWRVGRATGSISFNFNKIRAMIAARVATGIQVDLDQVVFAGMDSLFAATRRESNRQYPYPIMPVHWMSRDAEEGEDYHDYQFKAYKGKRTMRWNHAHPTWSYAALPFLSDVLYTRLTTAVPLPWMSEDEDMLNVMLWQHNVNKAWCKFDLEPALYLESVSTSVYEDPRWYPAGVPLVFYGAHNTKQVEEADWLLTVMAKCGDPAFRESLRCPAMPPPPLCKGHLRANISQLLSKSSTAVDELCCCVKSREDSPIFWQGRWYKDGSEVPETDSKGRPRGCLLP